MSDATEMELRVAKAIHEGWLPKWDECLPDELAHRVTQARKAIREMREPTVRMMQAPRTKSVSHAIECYVAMIDAASPIRPEDSVPIPVGLPRQNK